MPPSPPTGSNLTPKLISLAWEEEEEDEEDKDEELAPVPAVLHPGVIYISDMNVPGRRIEAGKGILALSFFCQRKAMCEWILNKQGDRSVRFASQKQHLVLHF